MDIIVIRVPESHLVQGYKVTEYCNINFECGFHHSGYSYTAGKFVSISLESSENEPGLWTGGCITHSDLKHIGPDLKHIGPD